MAKRFPFRTAIAGLTAMAMIAPVVTPANTTVLSAAVAQAQAVQAVTVAGPDNLAINTEGTFTANVPEATDGTVQFYLDGVPVGEPIKYEGAAVPQKITPTSYTSGDFKHTVTARYTDTEGFNSNPDGTAEFTTPVEIKPLDERNGSDSDRHLGSKIGVTPQSLAVSSLDNPVVIEAGSKYWLESGEKITSGRSRFYETGFNPPAGSTYVDGSMKRIGYTYQITTRGNDNGSIIKVMDGRDFSHPLWGTGSYPKVNKEYIGQQSDNTYWESNGNNIVIQAQFVAPETPGVYVPQYAVYKYRSDYHALRRMDDAAFLVPAKDLPEFKTKPVEEQPVEAAETTLTLSGDKARQDYEVANITATVSPAAAGTVTFFEGDKELGKRTAQNGKATLSQSFAEGTHQIRAEFTPDDAAAFGASKTTANHTLTVTKAQVAPTQVQTKTTLEVPAGGEAGKEVQLKATVVNAATDEAIGAGSVNFLIDGKQVGSAAVQGNGTATLNHTFNEPGAKNVVAQFLPFDTNTVGSTSNSATITVTQDTTVKLKADKQKPFVGEEVTVTATVTDNVAGKVQFTDAAGTQLHEATVAGGKATYTFTPKDNKPVEISAKFVPSQSVNIPSNTQNPLKIEPQLRKAEVSVTPGQIFTSGIGSDLTARVTPADAKGKVVFENTINGQTRSREAEVVNGTAVLKDIPFETVGERDVTVKFVPAEGSPYGPHESTGKVTVKPQPKDPQISIAQPAEAIAGQDVEITATLAVKNVPGVVKLFNGNTEIQNVAYDPATGKATATTQFPDEGIYEVRAEFIPAENAKDNYLGSNDRIGVPVKKDAQSEAPKAAETKTEWQTFPQGELTEGADTTFEIKVSDTADANATPEGDIELYDDTTLLWTQRVVDGVATISNKAIAGTYNLTAKFVPSDVTAYAPSETSPARELNVKTAPAEQTTITVTADKTTATPENDVKLTASVTPAAAGSVEFYNGDTKIDGATYDPATGEATVTTKLPEGENNITAKFTSADETKFTNAEVAANDAATVTVTKKADEQTGPTDDENNPDDPDNSGNEGDQDDPDNTGNDGDQDDQDGEDSETVESEEAKDLLINGVKSALKTALVLSTMVQPNQNVTFEIKDENGDIVAMRGVKSDRNGNARMNYAFDEGGNYTVRVLDAAGNPIANSTVKAEPKATVPTPDGTSKLDPNCRNAIIGGVVGSVLSMVLAAASQVHIPGIQQAITNIQKQLGIFNPQLAGAVERALPVAGGAAGFIGLATSIGLTVKACKADIEASSNK